MTFEIRVLCFSRTSREILSTKYISPPHSQYCQKLAASVQDKDFSVLAWENVP